MAGVKLTEKQKRFADYYIKLGNGAEAARQAGYQGTNHDNIATENLRKPAIKEYIDSKIDKKDDKRIAKQDEVLAFLTSAMRGELTEEVLMQGMKGVEREIKGTDIKDRLVAAKELGKRYLMDKQIDWNERKVKIAEKQIMDTDEDIEYEVVEDEEIQEES